MESTGISPVMFEIFGFEIRWYSVLILIGVVFAYFIITSESNRFQIKREFVFNMMFWTIIFGIIGARAWYVIYKFADYKDNLLDIFKIWKGGLAIHGGIIVGFIVILIYCHKYRVNTKKMLDICAPALIFAQAIGRWGNFFNSEAFGSPVPRETLEKIRIIPEFVIKNMYIENAYHLPMFYFESLVCLLGFIIMLILRRRRYTKVGYVFSFYFIWYGIMRFIIEIFREDSLMIGNLKVAQIVSVVLILVGIYNILVQMKKPKLDELYNKVDNDVAF